MTVQVKTKMKAHATSIQKTRDYYLQLYEELSLEIYMIRKALEELIE